MASTLLRGQTRLTFLQHSSHCAEAASRSSNAAFSRAALRRNPADSFRQNFRQPLAGRRRDVSVNARGFSVSASADRQVWLPGTPPAKHLDGTRPGDFGFDPLNLGSDPADLKWYVQAELVHARFAMLGAAGILGQEVLRKFGRDIPIWYETGAASYFAPTSTLFLVQMLLFGWVETKRYFDFVKPGSQKDPWFFWVEPSLEGLEPGYPGGPLFNISGFGTGVTKQDNVHEMRTKEIKNGRLAMVAFLGFAVQALVTKTGPLENLLDHLADPWHVTFVESVGKTL